MNTNSIASPAASDAISIPTTRATIIYRVLGVVAFALLTAIAANVKFPIPGTPVPATLQTFAVVVTGAALGPWLGTASMLLYVLLGAIGFQVFATGATGWEALAGPTAGYLAGFILAQPVIGLLTRGRSGGWGRMLIAVVAGHAVIFASGLVWLSIATGADLATTLALGLWPFVPGTIAKVLIGLPAGRGALRRIRPRCD